MNIKLLLAKLAIERCQHDLTHLCAVTHLTDTEGNDAPDDLRRETILGLIRSMNHELALMHQNIEGSLEILQNAGQKTGRAAKRA